MDDDYVYCSPDSGSSAGESLASPQGRFKATAGQAVSNRSTDLYSFIKDSLLPPVQRLCVCSEDEAILLLAAAGWQSRGVEETLYSGADAEIARARIGVAALGAASQDALPSLPPGVRLEDTYLDEVSLEEHGYADSDACARGHWFPKSTWQALLSAAAEGDARTALTHTRCPAAPTCNERIRGRMFRAYLPPAMLARLQHLTGIAMLEKRPDLGRLCPTAGCDSVVFLPKAGSAGSSAAVRSSGAPNLAVCTNSHTFCYACGCEEHAPATCAELSAWRDKERADGGTSLWVRENTKPCPKCKTSIEKNEGCMHMTCSVASCRHEFCWLCGGAWAGHSGSYYACNRTVRSGWLDGGLSARASAAAGSAAAAAAGGAGSGSASGAKKPQAPLDPRLEMRRYVFHVERVREHAHASDLARQGAAHVRPLRDRLVDASGCSASQLDFMVRAQDTIIRGQRAASFSYMHAWAIPAGEAATEESERYRALFADSQALMLRHLERLHSLMERRVVEAIIAAPSVLHAIAAAAAGSASVAGAGGAGAVPSPSASASVSASARGGAVTSSAAATASARENSGVILRLAEWQAQVAPLVDATARFIDAFLSAVAEGEFIAVHRDSDSGPVESRVSGVLAAAAPAAAASAASVARPSPSGAGAAGGAGSSGSGAATRPLSAPAAAAASGSRPASARSRGAGQLAAHAPAARPASASRQAGPAAAPQAAALVAARAPAGPAGSGRVTQPRAGVALAAPAPAGRAGVPGRPPSSR